MIEFLDYARLLEHPYLLFVCSKQAPIKVESMIPPGCQQPLPPPLLTDRFNTLILVLSRTELHTSWVHWNSVSIKVFQMLFVNGGARSSRHIYCMLPQRLLTKHKFKNKIIKNSKTVTA